MKIKNSIYLSFVSVIFYQIASIKNSLTHVIMPFHHSQLNKVNKNIGIWSKIFPCNLSDANFKKKSMIFFSSSSKNMTIEKYIVSSISESVYTCFSEFKFAYANLEINQNCYLKGSKNMFEKMISKKMNFGSIEPKKVFYMEPDCIPVRNFWLNSIDYESKSDFWIKGSIFRGLPTKMNSSLVSFRAHINGNALYNLVDEFSAFYFNHVRKFASKSKLKAYDVDIFVFLYSYNARYTSKYFHKFQYSDFVMNMWHSPYSVARILNSNSNTYLIHGGNMSP